MRRPWLLLVAFFCLNPLVAAGQGPADPALQQALAGPQRSKDFVSRDVGRHPLEELQFFGIKPSDAVVEIWPGGGYWTEILASYLHDHGTYYVAVPFGGAFGNPARAVTALQQKLTADPGVYGKVMLSDFDKGKYEIAPPGSIDLILTFRNYHDWMASGWGEDALAAFYKALKPGGILGFEDHRGRADVAQDPVAKSGYVRQDYMVDMAKKAGFALLASSEMNANPRDTKDYPRGVWTLPPTFALGAQDRDKYAAIGEGDNFVLKFGKPGG
jgi:predicted methyltransferase